MLVFSQSSAERQRMQISFSLLQATALLFSCIPHTDGQQTTATYFISGASTALNTDSLASAGLPSYSSLDLTEESEVTVDVNVCVPGGYSYDDAQTCTLCSAGKYSTLYASPSSASCIPCESGKYSTTIGADSNATCIDCPPATYFEQTGGASLAVCVSCPQNSSSYAGSKLLQACWCLPGYSGPNGQACSPCNTSTWCLWGQANPCPSNSKSSPMSSSLRECLCNPGYFGDTAMGGPDLTLCQVRVRVFFFLLSYPSSLLPPYPCQ
jgi:hypothetical protein